MALKEAGDTVCTGESHEQVSAGAFHSALRPHGKKLIHHSEFVCEQRHAGTGLGTCWNSGRWVVPWREMDTKAARGWRAAFVFHLELLREASSSESVARGLCFEPIFKRVAFCVPALFAKLLYAQLNFSFD